MDPTIPCVCDEVVLGVSDEVEEGGVKMRIVVFSVAVLNLEEDSMASFSQRNGSQRPPRKIEHLLSFHAESKLVRTIRKVS